MTNNTEDQIKSLDNNKFEPEVYIDFGKLIFLFWKDKILSLFIVILCLVVSILYIKNTPFEYDVSLELIKIENSGSAGASGSYSNVAKVLGITIGGSEGSSSFNLYKTLIKSRMISQLFAENQILMKSIFKNSWDQENKKFFETEKSLSTKIKDGIKSFIGFPVLENRYSGDDAIYDMLQNIVIIPGGSNNIIKLSYSTNEPLVGKIILENAHNFSDKFLKERSRVRTEKYITFLTQKLNQNTNQNIRLSLIQTLSGQHKSLMVSSSDLAYSAEKFGEIEISSYPISPKPRLILTFTLVFSLLLSFFISVFKNILLKKL